MEWKTPTVPNGGRQPKAITETGQTPDGVKRQVDLAYQVRMREGSDWPTPASRDWRSGKSNQHGRNARPLNEVATKEWPTPRSSPNENRTTKPAPSHGAGHGRVLAGEVQRYDGQPDLENPSTTGKPLGSWPTPYGLMTVDRKGHQGGGGEFHQRVQRETGKGKLNPNWVAQLMGYPDNWLDIE